MPLTLSRQRTLVSPDTTPKIESNDHDREHRCVRLSPQPHARESLRLPVVPILMRNPDNDLRLACAAATLFVTLGLFWLFEAFLNPPTGTVLGACCAWWRAIQFLPLLIAGYTAEPTQNISLPIFWLLITLQWFLVGSIVVSRIVSYLNRIADLLRREPEPFPQRQAIILS